MKMKKIKLKTNYGRAFDLILNAYLNFGLWYNNIVDDKELAVEYVNRKIRRLKELGL